MAMKNEDTLSLMAKTPLFADLSQTDRLAISKVMIRKQYEPGETIVNEEDEEGQTFFLINAGIVHVAAHTSEGNRAILATLKKGDFFGEMAILDGEPRSASVIAADHCDLTMLYRREFMDILQRYPKISIKLLGEMSRRLRNANRHINTLSLLSVYGRVADVLLRLGKEMGHVDGAGSIVIPLRPTHQVIAEMANTTRETVGRILSKLQKKRYIDIAGKKLVIYNEELLVD